MWFENETVLILTRRLCIQIIHNYHLWSVCSCSSSNSEMVKLINFLGHVSSFNFVLIVTLLTLVYRLGSMYVCLYARVCTCVWLWVDHRYVYAYVCVHIGAKIYLCGNHWFSPASIKCRCQIKGDQTVKKNLLSPLRVSWSLLVCLCIYVLPFGWPGV